MMSVASIEVVSSWLTDHNDAFMKNEQPKSWLRFFGENSEEATKAEEAVEVGHFQVNSLVCSYEGCICPFELNRI